MEAGCVGGLASFGQLHFGVAVLGDLRRVKRLVHIAQRIIAHPGGTLPAKMGEPADLKALYRLVDCKQVTHAAVIEPHRQLTLGRMCEHEGVVLLIHDTTQLDYTGKVSLKKLGQIAKGFHRGYLCHNTLAVTAEAGEVIGLANQILHVRPRIPKRESRVKRKARADRETRLWTQGSTAIGPAPAGRLWVDICDRGADLFEYLDHKHATGGSYVVRSKHDRIAWADGDEKQPVKLHGHATSLPTLGTWSIRIAANGGSVAGQTAAQALAKQIKPRDATVRVACGRVTLPAPRPAVGDHGDEPLETYVIDVAEVNPPAGVTPVRWVLLSNVPTSTFAEAQEHVGWYARRPIVEEFHKAQKTGCGIELPQFTDESRLDPMIALLSVVAVFLLTLRDLGRKPESADRPASELVPATWLMMLNVWRWRKRHRVTTVREFLLAVARMGGHQNRKSDGDPGWLTLWRGWQELMTMARGVDAMERCG